MAVSNKPLRHEIDVLVWKDGKILVSFIEEDGVPKEPMLPSSFDLDMDGVESPITFITEQDFGVKVKNVRDTGQLSLMTHLSSYPPAIQAAYRGFETKLYEADYDGKFEGVLTTGEAYKYVEMEPEELLEEFKTFFQRTKHGQHVVEHLNMVIQTKSHDK